MDAKTLIQHSKARFNLNAQKEQLKEKYQSKLIFADQGGLWTVNPNFLSQLASSNEKNVILLDNYQNPIKIDREELLRKANNLYLEVMEQWHTEYNELQNKR